jgi:hypothetical protein
VAGGIWRRLNCVDVLIEVGGSVEESLIPHWPPCLIVGARVDCASVRVWGGGVPRVHGSFTPSPLFDCRCFRWRKRIMWVSSLGGCCGSSF